LDQEPDILSGICRSGDVYIKKEGCRMKRLGG